MLVGLVVTGLALAAAGLPASAQSLCTPPVPPPPLNGAQATAEQLRAAIARARNFIGQANLYENCLKDELRMAQARDDGDSVASRIDRQAEVRLAANRKLKEKVSSDAAVAMEAYKKAHAD